MEQAAYCLFETPLGACGIAWKARETSRTPPVVTFFQLPEATRSLTDTRIAGRSGGRKARVPPPHIAGIIKRVQKHLRGEVQDFLDIVVDLDPWAPLHGRCTKRSGRSRRDGPGPTASLRRR